MSQAAHFLENFQIRLKIDILVGNWSLEQLQPFLEESVKLTWQEKLTISNRSCKIKLLNRNKIRSTVAPCFAI